MSTYIVALWQVLLDSSLFLLIGLIGSGLMHSFIGKEKIQLWLSGQGFWPIVKAAALGVPLPLCSCSVIPTAITLKKNGASNGATASFLISTPESGVDSIVLSYGLLGPLMAIVRPLAAFISAILAGVLQLYFNKENAPTQSAQGQDKSCCHAHPSLPSVSLGDKLMSGFHYAFVDLVKDMSLWYCFGLLFAAFLASAFPLQDLAVLNGVKGKIFIILFSIPLYICASASTPIAAVLMNKGLSPGSTIIFLLLGPATNAANIFSMKKYLGLRGILLNLAAITMVTLIFSFILDSQFFATSIFGQHIDLKGPQHDHDVSMGVPFYKEVCAVLVTILLLKGVYDELRHRWEGQH